MNKKTLAIIALATGILLLVSAVGYFVFVSAPEFMPAPSPNKLPESPSPSPASKIKIILGSEEIAIPVDHWQLISTAPDSSIPMVKIDGKFMTFTWGGIPLASGEQNLGDHLCETEDRCDGMARLTGATLDNLRFDPFDSSRNAPIAVYRRPPASQDLRPYFSDMWPMGTYYNEEINELLIFVGADDRPCGTPCGDPYDDRSKAWYGTGELLISRDKGRTFERGGRILQPPINKSEWARRFKEFNVYGPIHSGATISPDKKYVYLYFWWSDDPSEKSGLALARSKIDGTNTGRPGTWFYYANGTWIQLGIGGEPSILIPNVNMGHMSYNDHLKQYVLIGSRFGEEDIEKRGYSFYFSPDAIHWTKHEFFLKTNMDFDKPNLPPARVFPTVFSPDSNWDGISKENNYLYYAYIADTARSEPRELRRRSLKFILESVRP